VSLVGTAGRTSPHEDTASGQTFCRSVWDIASSSGTIERMTTTDAQQVLEAAKRRADALAAGDAHTLRQLMHPALQWTTFKGEVLSLDQYIEGNTGGALVWRSQRLDDRRVVVVGDTAVLTALVTDEVQKDGHELTFSLRLTQTWVRASSGWQCLAGHAGPEVGDSRQGPVRVRHAFSMEEQIVVATTPEQYAEFGALIREYWSWLHVRYAEVPELMDDVAAHQGLEEELAALPARYGPPEGKVLLALRDGQVVGGVAYRDLHDGSCEMKRLFVPDRNQGHGTGRSLCRALIDLATSDGYALMRLDTGYENTEALAMYASLGFRECPPYHDYPDHVQKHLRFLQRVLAAG